LVNGLFKFETMVQNIEPKLIENQFTVE